MEKKIWIKYNPNNINDVVSIYNFHRSNFLLKILCFEQNKVFLYRFT